MIAAYGAPPMQPGHLVDPDDWQRHLDDLRRAPSFTFTPSGLATKADLDAAVARIESQMLALLAYVKHLAKPKRRAKRRVRR